jgi:hypothetical protein
MVDKSNVISGWNGISHSKKEDEHGQSYSRGNNIPGWVDQRQEMKVLELPGGRTHMRFRILKSKINSPQLIT